MEAILVLQGGGSLGAYECGAYQALAPWLRANGHQLAAVCGTSIGAINASIIAARYPDEDQGARALVGFWEHVANGSVPFLPPVGELAGWNAVWTSLLLGNPRLFRPILPFWTMIPPVAWAPFQAFYDAAPIERTLAEYFDSIGPRHAQPRLIVTAVDLNRIKPAAFDSWDMAITPRHVLASSSLPPSFPETAIGADRYWDGGLWSNTPLREALGCLRKPGSPGPKAMEECLVFIVDLFAPAGNQPPAISGNWDVWALRDRVLFQDKTEYDEKATGWVNRHIDFVREAAELLQSLPVEHRRAAKTLARHVDRELAALRDEGRLRLTIHRIIRSDGAAQDASREIDFSPERIDGLMAQGRADAAALLTRIDAGKGG